MASLRLFGDEAKAGLWIPHAKKKLSELQEYMARFGLIAGNKRIPLPDGGYIFLSSTKCFDIYLDQITIKIGAGGFSSFYLIFGTEWGLQGFKVNISKDGVTIMPADIPTVTGDSFTMIQSGHVELDESLNPVWVKGSSVASIDRENKLYTFRVNRSAQDTIYGMAYDLYADRIHSYASEGFPAIVGGTYEGISEDYSAGTPIVYTPFENGISVNPNKGSPYGVCIGRADLDALGRRPYQINFNSKEIIKNGENVYRSRISRIDENIWITGQQNNYEYLCTPERLAQTVALLPPGVTSESPAFTLIDEDLVTQICSGIPGILGDGMDHLNFIQQYSNILHGEWNSYHYYNEAKRLPDGSYELISKGVPLFKNTTDISIDMAYAKYTRNNLCNAVLYTRISWVRDHIISKTNSVKYDVRACLGGSKFIYDKSIREDVLQQLGDIVIASNAFQVVWDHSYPVRRDRSTGVTEVYIGDWLFKSNAYSQVNTVDFPGAIPFTVYVQDGTYNRAVTEEQKTQNETFFMDYDYDIERGENGVFFYQQIQTVYSLHEDTQDREYGGSNDAWIIRNIAETKTYTFGAVVILNGIPTDIPLSLGYTLSRMNNYLYSYHYGSPDVVEDAGDIYTGGGQRIWLATSHMTDREMVLSYVIEDVRINDDGTLKTTPIKIITEFINIGNDSLPIGYRKTFESLPLSNVPSPAFTITKLKREGPGTASYSLRVMVVAMTTFDMTTPAEPVSVELLGDEYFNIAITPVDNATHYGIFIAPTTVPLFYPAGVDPMDWFKPIITSETNINITEELLGPSRSEIHPDTRDMSMQGSSYDILKYGSPQNIAYGTAMESPRLVPAMAIIPITQAA